MNASSTVLTRATMDDGHLRIICPEWCTIPLDSHGEPGRHSIEAEASLACGGVLVVVDHPGPAFGPFLCSAEVELATGAVRPLVDLDYPVAELLVADSDSTDLRELAAHALAAADWLEANR